jgi:hypothetical protein
VEEEDEEVWMGGGREREKRRGGGCGFVYSREKRSREGEVAVFILLLDLLWM